MVVGVGFVCIGGCGGDGMIDERLIKPLIGRGYRPIEHQVSVNGSGREAMILYRKAAPLIPFWFVLVTGPAGYEIFPFRFLARRYLRRKLEVTE